MFVDYSYYANTFAGTIVPAEAFPALERDAERYLKYITRGRYAAVTDTTEIDMVKKALCAACDSLYSFDQAYKDIPDGVASESTDGHSVSFVKIDPIERTEHRKGLMYYTYSQELEGTDLLYQGVI